MIIQATQHLIATVRDAASTEADIQSTAQSFFTAVGRASVRETNEALSTLAEFFSLDDSKRAGFLALVCGALVERDGDPLTIAQPLRGRLHSLLEPLLRSAQVFRANALVQLTQCRYRLFSQSIPLRVLDASGVIKNVTLDIVCNEIGAVQQFVATLRPRLKPRRPILAKIGAEFLDFSKPLFLDFAGVVGSNAYSVSSIPACRKMLLKVPTATSSANLPGTVEAGHKLLDGQITLG